MLKLALIADIHHGPDIETKKGSAALGLLAEFIRFVGVMRPDAVIDLGDRITDTDRKQDLVRLGQVAEKFAALVTPRYHLLGNHDCAELDSADNERVLGHPLVSHSVEMKGFHLVFWNCKTRTQPQGRLELALGDIEWLANELATATLPSIIFSHVPLDNGSMRGNYYFEQAWPQYGHYSLETSAKIRNVLENIGNVVLCVNAHAHWQAYHWANNIHYLTLPSLTETFATFPEANAAWSELHLGQNIRLKIHGLTPMEMTLPIRKKGAHWQRPHGDKIDSDACLIY